MKVKFPEDVPCPKCFEKMNSTGESSYRCKCGFAATTDYLVGYWDGWKDLEQQLDES